MFTSDALELRTDRLAARLPRAEGRLFFVSSGSEAVKTAIKLARQAQGTDHARRPLTFQSDQTLGQ